MTTGTLMQGWFLEGVAIPFEVSGTVSVKLSDGFSRMIPSTFLFVFYALSFTLLVFALKKIEISNVYHVWSGQVTTLVAVI